MQKDDQIYCCNSNRLYLMRLFFVCRKRSLYSDGAKEKTTKTKGKEDEVLCIKLTIFTWDYFLWRGKMQ